MSYQIPNKRLKAEPSATQASRPSASVARPDHGTGRPSIRLTVKAPPSRLREATSGIPPNPYANTPDESDDTSQPAVRTSSRTTRNQRTVVEPDTSDEDISAGDEDIDAEAEAEEQEEEEVDEELLANEDSELDDDDDDDGELSRYAPPRPPPITTQHPSSSETNKPSVTVTAPPNATLTSVEAQQMASDEEDEALSELLSNASDSADEDLPPAVPPSDPSSTPSASASRSATPDPSKLTRRQRGLPSDAGLLALSNEAQTKKHLSAEEHALRRAEMARRRKNLSDRRNEQEKRGTIDKLLKKPGAGGRRRARADMMAGGAAARVEGRDTPGVEDGEEQKPDPLFVRWVCRGGGSRLGVPLEWIDAPVGELFGAASTPGSMVREVAS